MSREYKTGLVEGPVTEAEKAKAQRDKLLAAVAEHRRSRTPGQLAPVALRSDSWTDALYDAAAAVEKEVE